MLEHTVKETDAVTDPLVGSQEHTDSSFEAAHVPHKEVALEPHAVGRPQHARWLAGILGVFLGSLGIHRFYLGFTTVGLFQLTLTLAMISAVIIGATVTASQHAVAVAAGVVMLTVFWGAAEGVCILCHVLNTDAQGHPLA